MASEATKMAIRGNMHMNAMVVEVAHVNFEVSLDFRGHLEATMASKATKMAIRGNMHMNTMVLEVGHFNYEVKFDL